MKYRSAFLGCGPRAREHARVYREIRQIEPVAACDLDEQRRESFGRDFGIPRLYEDYEAMLAEEKPDILHLVTQPNFRVVPIKKAAEAGVKAIIVEKPVVLLPSQAQALREIAAQTSVRIVVNTQRRYFKPVEQLHEVVTSGKLGDIVFARCITLGNMLSMGPHLMDLLLWFLGDVSPVEVWAQAQGAEDFKGTHASPTSLMANYTFPGKVNVFFECSKDSVGTWGETVFWQHCEVDLWGTAGRGWWTQRRGWGYQTKGMAEPEVGPTDWEGDEFLGQHDFTIAVADWLDDDSNPHRNHLENALRGFDALMAAVKSASLDRRIKLPVEVTDKDVFDLRDKLQAREGSSLQG